MKHTELNLRGRRRWRKIALGFARESDARTIRAVLRGAGWLIAAGVVTVEELIVASCAGALARARH